MNETIATRRVKRLTMIQKFSPIVILAVLFGVMTIVNPSFLQRASLMNLLKQCAVYGILAIGETYMIMTGGIDLSVRICDRPGSRPDQRDSHGDREYTGFHCNIGNADDFKRIGSADYRRAFDYRYREVDHYGRCKIRSGYRIPLCGACILRGAFGRLVSAGEDDFGEEFSCDRRK